MNDKAKRNLAKTIGSCAMLRVVSGPSKFPLVERNLKNIAHFFVQTDGNYFRLGGIK